MRLALGQEKKNLCSYFSLTLFLSFSLSTLSLCRCNGAAGIVAPCLWSPRARLTHAASCCLLPLPVSTATGTLRAAAASAPAASASCGTGYGAGAQTQSFTGDTKEKTLQLHLHTHTISTYSLDAFPHTPQADFPTAIALPQPSVSTGLPRAPSVVKGLFFLLS